MISEPCRWIWAELSGSQCHKCCSLVLIDTFYLKVNVYLFILLLIVKMLCFRDYGTAALMAARMYMTSAKHFWDGARGAGGALSTVWALCRNTKDHPGRGTGMIFCNPC